jgi:cytochrome P450
MVDRGEAVDVGSLPLAPKSPLPYGQRWRAARAYHTGCETLRDAGGPVTRSSLGPKWMLPPFVVTTSPKGARDVLSRSYPFVDRELPVFDEQRRLNGGSLFNFKHDAWLPRRRALQPVFTKQHVTQFAGHMAEGADKLARMWSDGAELDLDEECRTVTLRVLGRSVLAWMSMGGPMRWASRFAPSRPTSSIAVFGRYAPQHGCPPPHADAHAPPTTRSKDSPTTSFKPAGPTRLATHHWFAR